MKKGFSIFLLCVLQCVVAVYGQTRLVTPLDAPSAPLGLDGRHIALWASHGRYFDQGQRRWAWQRGRLFGTVEDLLTRSITLPFLVPMLENAGATVLLPQERDTGTFEKIIDFDTTPKLYSETKCKNKWSTPSATEGWGYAASVLTDYTNPFVTGSVRQCTAVAHEKDASKATWSAIIPQKSRHAVYVSYASLPRSATDALYRVYHSGGVSEFFVNQAMGGGTWIYLGTFDFDASTLPQEIVELVAVSATKGAVVTADAVKIGGGVGSVERYGVKNPFPKFAEGSRYWLQWAGMPESVYNITEGEKDYTDDYKSRALWVNHIAGGSKRVPKAKGLRIPVDLSFALHTDAGISEDGGYIGSLPIISTKGATLGDGRSRQQSKRFANEIMSELSRTITGKWCGDWQFRKMRDKSYHEAREPQVPAMLLELLSHQNPEDLRLALDPSFRFDVARAIYVGMLRYLAGVSGKGFVVQPLPVSDFAISGGEGKYSLSWIQTSDPLNPSARPDYYIVEESIDGGTFTELAVVERSGIDVEVDADRIYAYRIVAVNRGGRSFPSQTLSLCHNSSAKGQVMIVNGFDLVSGPEAVFEDGYCVGFDYDTNPGIGYHYDMAMTGRQSDFNPFSEFINNENPGFGASGGELEAQITAGNTFDYPVVHGKAIKEAGYSFISSSMGGFLASESNYQTVDLIMGRQKEISGYPYTKFKVFTPGLLSKVELLANRGTCFVISGCHWASDLTGNGFDTAADAKTKANFAKTVLGITDAVVNTHSGGIVTGKVGTFDFNTNPCEEIYPAKSPETLVTVRNAETQLAYADTHQTAAVVFNGRNHKAFSMGFPFETILDEATRNKLMRLILKSVDSNQ